MKISDKHYIQAFRTMRRVYKNQQLASGMVSCIPYCFTQNNKSNEIIVYANGLSVDKIKAVLKQNFPPEL